VAVVVFGRRLGGFDAATAGRVLGATGLIVLAMALYETLLLRDVLRPLLAQLGSRHRLPAPDIRSPVGLGAKMVIFLAASRYSRRASCCCSRCRRRGRWR